MAQKHRKYDQRCVSSLPISSGRRPAAYNTHHNCFPFPYSRTAGPPARPTAAVKSIEDLSTIFKELAVLVIDQGTILDRIDFNMEQVRALPSHGHGTKLRLGQL